jgi:hypothetical protein
VPPLRLRIGNLLLDCTGDADALPAPPPGDPHADFVTTDPAASEIRLPLRIRRGTPPAGAEGMPDREPCFRHRGGWEVRRRAPDDATLWAALPVPPGTHRWQRVLRLGPGEAELWIPPGASRPEEPLAWLVTEVLWLLALPRTGGALLHASGVLRGEAAWLFSGPSGSGKSTLATLLRDGAAGDVLADESVVLWREGPRLRAGGTPWPGSGGTWSARRGEVGGIAFLAHGRENRLDPLAPAEAAAGLLRQTFLPHWSRPALESATELATALAASPRVRTASFAFLPEASAVRFLETALFAPREADARESA